MRVFPFSAIVGQEDLRLALVLGAVSPAIGGVLLRGERGTAKSTAVRALAGLLPEIEVVAGCPYNCDPAAPDPACPAGPHQGVAGVRRPAPFVELPVGATVERVTGALDVERALAEGVRAFQPGVLAAAHRGVLSVDEVNLLPDHVVDVLLDAAALGVNYVERDGLSVRHQARFLLVGTMNPEEGELRPQLLDRFGLTVEARAATDPALRAEVVKRRLAFEQDPGGFWEAWWPHEEALRRRIAAARRLLPLVRLPGQLLVRISAACTALGVEGLRADVVTAKAAVALAAWEGREEVSVEDVRRAALLALPHRRRRGPLDRPGLDPGELDRALGFEGPERPEGPGGPEGGGPGGGDREQGGGFSRGEEVTSPAPPSVPVLLTLEGGTVPGRRAEGASAQGLAAGETERAGGKLSLVGTIRAAAPYQRARGRTGAGLALRRADLRWERPRGKTGALVVLVLDASASMAAHRRMAQVKGAVLSLLLDAYRRRDRVALVAFRGERAELLCPVTGAVERAAEALAYLPAGGRTPLAAGLSLADRLIATEAARDGGRRPLLVLVTDGRANAGGPDPLAAALAAARRLRERDVEAVVIDTEPASVSLGFARQVAGALGAPVIRLEEVVAAPSTPVPPGGRTA